MALADAVAPPFLRGGGDMGALMRGHSWERTSLGPPERWPEALKSALGLCLDSAFPIAIYWGDELALLYNDAWRPILGHKHPWALGRPAREVWPEIWEAIEPVFRQVRSTGKAAFVRDGLLAMHRFGYTEECYFDYTINPIRLGEGVGGIFNVVMETTFRVIGERRSRAQRDFMARLAPAQSLADVMELAAAGLADQAADVPFALLYRVGDDGSAHLERAVGIASGSAVAPYRVALNTPQAGGWPLADAVRTGSPQHVANLGERFGEPLPAGPWPEPAREALVLPLSLSTVRVPVALLVLGASPRRALDLEYRGFLESLGAHLAQTIATASAHESERERAAALAQLRREAERRQREFLDTAPAMLWVTEPDGSCSYLSRGWYDFTGQREADALGFGWTSAIHPDDQPLAAHAFVEANEKRVPFSIDYRLRRADGSYRWAIDAGRPRLGPDGEFLGYVGSVIDVQERKEAEQQLRQSEARYRAVVESQRELVCRFRPTGEILFANDAYAHALGTTAEAMAPRSFWEYVPADDHAHVRAMLDALTPENPEARIENRFETSDGVRWMLWTNRALAFDSAGRLQEAQSTGVDITDRKRVEQALEEADRRKDEFIATLSHELRNPLAPLRNALHLVRLSGNSDPQLAPVHRMMERQVDHLVRLVDDLLEISRITRGALELRSEPVQLATIVHNAVETADALIRSADHRLDIALPSEALVLPGDPVRLGQILANLLNNAANYTPRGGHIELRAQRTGKHVEIIVRDNGNGIAPDQLERIFEMFNRGAGSNGLGIGLALARRLAQMHGGSIRAQSDGLGHGSTFIVALPLDDRNAAAADTANESAAALPQKRVLVVDDNRDAANSLAMLLEFLGADVAVAHSGREALERFVAYRPAVVLLDIGMPEMDGYEVARTIRSRDDGAPVTLIALTGWGQEEDRRRARAAGFDHHLVKPADIDALQALLATL
jgi:PAS domain S-box-containing protein